MQVRRKGQHTSRTFPLKSEAKAWVVEAEGRISREKSVDAVQADATTAFRLLIDLHIRDLADGSNANDVCKAEVIGTEGRP